MPQTTTTNAAREAGRKFQLGTKIEFGDEFAQDSKSNSLGQFETLMGKRVMVTFGEDKRIIGRLGRNSFHNRTLCITTGSGNEELYGNFFFEPSSVQFIQEIL